MHATKLISFPLPQSPVVSLMAVQQPCHAPGDLAWEQAAQRLKLCVAFDTGESTRQTEVPIQRVELSESSAVKHHRGLWLARETAEPRPTRGWGINE